MVLEHMGTSLVSMTTQAFRNEALRALPWPPVKKKRGAPLYASGALKHSIRITGLSNYMVTVGTDRTYAGYQQFGTKRKDGTERIPARPFFPFNESGEMTPAAKQKIEAAAKVALAKLLKA
jgi:phage gpG-like protein